MKPGASQEDGTKTDAEAKEDSSDTTDEGSMSGTVREKKKGSRKHKKSENEDKSAQRENKKSKQALESSEEAPNT